MADGTRLESLGDRYAAWDRAWQAETVRGRVAEKYFQAQVCSANTDMMDKIGRISDKYDHLSHTLDGFQSQLQQMIDRLEQIYHKDNSLLGKPPSNSNEGEGSCTKSPTIPELHMRNQPDVREIAKRETHLQLTSQGINLFPKLEFPYFDGTMEKIGISLASSNSIEVEKLGYEHENETLGVEGLSDATVMSKSSSTSLFDTTVASSKSVVGYAAPGIKGVDWSAFYGQTAGNGFGSYKDSFCELDGSSMGDAFENVSGVSLYNGPQIANAYNVDSLSRVENSINYVQNDGYNYDVAANQNTHLNNSHYWDNQHPGWKYNLGQVDDSYLQQSAQSTVGSGAEVSMVQSATNWNQVPQASDFTELLQYHDAKVLEHASICLTRIVEAFAPKPENLDELCNRGHFTQVAALISLNHPGRGQTSLRISTYNGLIRLLSTCANGSAALGTKSLLQLGISGILKYILSWYGLVSSIPSSALSRSPEQIFEIVNNHLTVVVYIEDMYMFYGSAENECMLHEYMHSQPEIYENMRAFTMNIARVYISKIDAIVANFLDVDPCSYGLWKSFSQGTRRCLFGDPRGRGSFEGGRNVMNIGAKMKGDGIIKAHSPLVKAWDQIRARNGIGKVGKWSHFGDSRDKNQRSAWGEGQAVTTASAEDHARLAGGCHQQT